MLKLLRSLVSSTSVADARPSGEVPSGPLTAVEAAGVDAFDVLVHLRDANGFSVLDWGAAQRWVDRIPDEHEKAAAWAACEQAWLTHLRATMGPEYALLVRDGVALLSTLEVNVANAAIDYVGKTRQRIVRVLDGITQIPEWGYDILLVFDDEDAYYRYVAHYYPEAGEFAASGGMYIHAGCGHFVTVKADLRAIEPVIAHELTHGCLGHLPIPAWLNEGLAVNTERRLSPSPSGLYGNSNPQQMHARHQRFWKAQEMQEFWSGKSFLRTDEGNELSYDLARIMVSQFASDWESFRSFVLEADGADGGSAAAQRHLGVALGRVACALMERDFSPDFEPDPSVWDADPERGAFHEGFHLSLG